MSLRLIGAGQVAVVAMVAVSVAAIVRAICHSVFNETIPYTPFYPAIMVATMYGRLRGGLIATVMAAFAASFWLSPFGQPLIQEPTDLIGLVLFLAVSGLVVGLCEAMQRARQTAEVALEEQCRAVTRESSARVEAEEANRLKDQFLASASHELRTPLQAILGWAELLARGDVDVKDRAAGLEIIARNARVQSRLIEDMLDISRIVAGKMRLSPRIIDPRPIIDSAIQTVAIAAQAKQISIVQRYDKDELQLWADPDRFQQIIWNLLSNSIKFSPHWSTVRISVQAKAGALEIEVSDEGRGVDAEFLPYLFERFHQADMEYSRRHDGLGLGLSIVKQFVELHGGTITGSSAGIGKGLSILISMPVVDDIIALQSADSKLPFIDESSLQAEALRGVRVLVVEDDPSTCDLIARTLRERHCQVVAVTSVEQALKAVKGFEPDVIVSDIAMPEQDGYELLRRLRTQGFPRRRIPALALTALSSDEDRRHAFDAGYRMHLTKPVDASALSDAVAELAGA